MTIRDVQPHLERTLGTEFSHETIANITDAVAEEVKAWPARPSEPVHPILYLDALMGRSTTIIRFVTRPPTSGRGRQRRHQARAGALGPDQRGAKLWAGVLAELRNRGVQDVLIACCDGLTGFPEAIEATWPRTVVQTCVGHPDPGLDAVHLLQRPQSRRRRRSTPQPPKPAPRKSRDIFERSTWGKKYPAAVHVWREASEQFIPFLEFPPEVWKII